MELKWGLRVYNQESMLAAGQSSMACQLSKFSFVLVTRFVDQKKVLAAMWRRPMPCILPAMETRGDWDHALQQQNRTLLHVPAGKTSAATTAFAARLSNLGYLSLLIVRCQSPLPPSLANAEARQDMSQRSMPHTGNWFLPRT